MGIWDSWTDWVKEKEDQALGAVGDAFKVAATAASTIVSVETEGATPIYGEPDGMTVAERRKWLAPALDKYGPVSAPLDKTEKAAGALLNAGLHAGLEHPLGLGLWTAAGVAALWLVFGRK